MFPQIFSFITNWLMGNMIYIYIEGEDDDVSNLLIETYLSHIKNCHRCNVYPFPPND